MAKFGAAIVASQDYAVKVFRSVSFNIPGQGSDEEIKACMRVILQQLAVAWQAGYAAALEAEERGPGR